MARLIDADKIMADIAASARSTSKDYSLLSIARYISIQPTIDAVPVVRCKDCRWGREVCGNIECSVDRNLPPEYHGYEWYCPNGERRTNEVN